MSKYKKIWMVVILLLSCVLSACQKEQEEEVTLTIIHAWGGTEADHMAMRDIFEGFQEKNQGIKLQLISMPTREEMLRKVEDMIMVGDIPDVITFSGMGGNSTYDFIIENDFALDLMPYLKEDDDFMNSISEANLKYWETDEGRLFTITDVLSLSGGYWYNEDIFRSANITEVPSTWDEFLIMCETLQAWSDANNAAVKPLGTSAEGYLYFLDHLLASNRSAEDRAVKEQKIISDDNEVEEGIELLKTIYAFSASAEEKYSYRDETDLFNEGKIALYVNGVWGASMISEDIVTKYALLPTISGEVISCESACMGYVVGKSGNVEKEKAAISFLRYMLTEEVQTRILEETEQIPANPGVSLLDFKEERPRLYQAADLVLGAERKIEVPDNLWKSSSKNIFTENILGVLSDTLPVREFLIQLK